MRKTIDFSDDGIESIVENYEYDATGKLRVIERWQRKTNKTTYVKGSRDSVELSSIQFHQITSINDLVKIEIKVKNLADRDILLSILPNSSLRFDPVDSKINKSDSVDLTIKFKLPSGQVDEKINLSSEEWTLELEFTGFGYHLDVSDFKADGEIILPRTFYFHRTGEEYQMEIIKSNKASKSTFIPISKQILSIDLKPGTYNITLVGPTEKLTKEIEIK
jgi:hypothetical protein